MQTSEVEERSDYLAPCTCPRLSGDSGETEGRAYLECVDRGGHDWLIDGVTCCLTGPRNWRQVCHCGARRWTGPPRALDGCCGWGTTTRGLH